MMASEKHFLMVDIERAGAERARWAVEHEASRRANVGYMVEDVYRRLGLADIERLRAATVRP